MYFVYMLECENGSIYTGMTSDVERRFSEHTDSKKSRKGAKYTRAFKPKCIAAAFKVKDRSEALHIESKIKSKSRSTKLLIIERYKDELKKKPSIKYISIAKINKFLK